MQNHNTEENLVAEEICGASITITVDPLQKLKKLTEQELNKLNQERRSMEAVHSNLDLLIKRYNLEKSYFGQMSSWYGSKAWWVKILLFILVAALGACIGLLCHMPITIVLIASALYIFFAFFFINHYTITQQQTKSLCEDIIELEKSLTDTINHFNELSNNLKKIMIGAHELNIKMLADVKSLKENIKFLNSQLAKYKLIIDELNLARDSIVQTTNKVRENLQAGDRQYQENCSLISQKSSQIDITCASITTSGHSLESSSVALKEIIDRYQQATVKISHATINMEKLLTCIKNSKLPQKRVIDYKSVEIRPLRKLASDSNCAKTRSAEPHCTLVHEDSSTDSTKQFGAAVEFPNRSIISAENDILFDDASTSNSSLDLFSSISNDVDDLDEATQETSKQILAEAKQTRDHSQKILAKIKISRSYGNSFNRPLRKLASDSNCAKTRSAEPHCTVVHEDSSTDSTKQFWG